MDGHRGFHAPHKRYGPETMSEDLRRAMTHVKQAAVAHRNNYIGHGAPPVGLTAEANSATLLLEAAGVDPDVVHRAVTDRLSMGASQAAERIDCADLLIGLAGVGRGVAAAVLADAGFEASALDA